MAGLERAERELAARTDSGLSGEVLPDLHAYLDALHELMGRSQPASLAARLQALASSAAQHAAFLSDALGLNHAAYQLSAEAEALARESGEPNRLAEVLIDRSDQVSRRAHGPDGLARSIALAEAAHLTMDETAPSGLRGWIEGLLAADLAFQGDDRRSGSHLEAARRATDGAPDANLYCDLDSAWIEDYGGLRALHLGHLGEAIAAHEEVRRRTDPRLLWERTRALYRLAWAYALAGETERSAGLLAEAVALASAHGDRRGVEAALCVRDRHLARWRTDPAVRRLDEAIRVARAAARTTWGGAERWSGPAAADPSRGWRLSSRPPSPRPRAGAASMCSMSIRARQAARRGGRLALDAEEPPEHQGQVEYPDVPGAA